ncbi:MAG TPA: S8 family serine peptidase [Gammaproteobacteria bacterium]
MHRQVRGNSIVLLFAAIAVAAASIAMPASAGGLLGAKLAERLQATNGPHEVIVTFTTQDAVGRLAGELGIDVIALKTLPMVGAVLTEAQIETIRQWDNVESIYLNADLEYYNFTSGEITGGHYVHDNYGVKGEGVTVAVLDSGTDATHPDLAYGTKTVQNVKIIGDLGLLGGMNVFLEGQLNTDTSSGHGTHVAGTVAGTGAASANDERRANYYAGIAPEASLVGISAGEGIAILHALLGFDYAIANQDRYSIDIITNSWGGGDGAAFDPNNPINQASYEAYRRGMIVTFAASNSGPAENTLNQYAIAPWVINVAAGTPEKTLADFSSRGVADDFYKHPDITAPGSGIISTRAVNTPLPVLGPVLDPEHPEYHLYYAGMSGTSMATPFIAGTAALLLDANPQLSPDQVEEILMVTAQAMPAYEFHETGAGYVDVRAAVESAMNTIGERQQFLAGDTKWASGGQWNAIDNQSDLLQYYGNWKVKSASDASNGSYQENRTGNGGSVFLRFAGSAFKIAHHVDPRGGVADIYVDGVKYDRISFYSDVAGYEVSPGVNGLTDEEHLVELRAVDGRVYLDGVLVDGEAYAPGVRFVEESETWTGTMGPSVENLVVHEFPFEVDTGVVNIRAELGWTGGVDIDLYLVGPDGNEVASGATLNNPEVLDYDVTQAGTYTWRVTGYATVIANYTLISTLTRAVSSAE